MEPSRSLVGGSPGVIVQGSRGVRLEHQDRIGSQRALKAHTHVPSAPGLDCGVVVWSLGSSESLSQS